MSDTSFSARTRTTLQTCRQLGGGTLAGSLVAAAHPQRDLDCLRGCRLVRLVAGPMLCAREAADESCRRCPEPRLASWPWPCIGVQSGWVAARHPSRPFSRRDHCACLACAWPLPWGVINRLEAHRGTVVFAPATCRPLRRSSSWKQRGHLGARKDACRLKVVVLPKGTAAMTNPHSAGSSSSVYSVVSKPSSWWQRTNQCRLRPTGERVMGGW